MSARPETNDVEALELRAIFALIGGHSNPAAIIADYLENSETVSPRFAKMLADALRGKLEGGVQIDFPKSGTLSFAGRVETRREWGRMIRAWRESGMTQEDFRNSDLCRPKVKRAKFDEAHAYYKRFEKWFEAAKDTDPRLAWADDIAASVGRNDREAQLKHFAYLTFTEDDLRASPKDAC